jgi:HEAT repeat protein
MPYSETESLRSEAAMYVFQMAAVPKRRLHHVVVGLLDIIDDSALSADVRAQAAEAVGDQLAYTKQRSLRKTATARLTARLADRAPEVRFWSAFSLGKLGAKRARPALRALTGDENIVAGWWSVGREAADALDWIEGRHTGRSGDQSATS